MGDANYEQIKLMKFSRRMTGGAAYTKRSSNVEEPLFGKEVFPKPPEGGYCGTAYVPRKQGALPQGNEYCSWERLEGDNAITQQWIEKKPFERPRKGIQTEWLSTTIVVPRNGRTYR